MECRMCKYWLKDTSFPGDLGFCSAKNALVSGSSSCELFRRKEEGPIAIQVLSY